MSEVVADQYRTLDRDKQWTYLLTVHEKLRYGVLLLTLWEACENNKQWQRPVSACLCGFD